MIVKTGREEEQETNQTVKAGRIQRIDKCKYLGMTISADGQLTQHIKELNSRCDIINRERNLMPVLLYEMEVWKKLSKSEIQNLEKTKGKALKRIFSLPITILYIGLIIETGVRPAEQRINYSSLMIYHSIIRIDWSNK